MTHPAQDTQNPAPSRRSLLAGAGAAGAAVVAVSALPLIQAAPGADAVAALAPPPEQGGGYQVTPHVLQYYQTARV